jgi:hypothetical protein
MLKRLFGKVRSLFGKKDKRKIFRYWDGSRYAHADPIKIDKDLRKIGGDDWMEHTKILDKDTSKVPMSDDLRAKVNKEIEESVDFIVDLSRKTFSLPGLSPDGGGLTDNEAIDVLVQYFNFLNECEESVRPLS